MTLVASDIIKSQLRVGHWKAYRDNVQIDDLDLKINAHSVDITLHPKLIRISVAVGYEAIDPLDNKSFLAEPFEINSLMGWILRPDDFVLGCACERFDSDEPIHNQYPTVRPDLPTNIYVTQLYDGRSTCGRISIQSHMTAGYGDFGFKGHFTLECATKLPVRLRPRMRIGQVSFVPLLTWASPPEAYTGAYTQTDQGPAIPVLGKDRF